MYLHNVNTVPDADSVPGIQKEEIEIMDWGVAQGGGGKTWASGIAPHPARKPVALLALASSRTRP